MTDETLPQRWRLGSLHDLEARQDFMTAEERRAVDSARERLYSVLTEDVAMGLPERPVETQGRLF